MDRSRRAFLTDLGRTSAGLIVFGSGLAACSGDDPTIEGPTTTADDLTPTTEDPVVPADDTALTPTEANAATNVLTVDLGFVAAYIFMRGGEAAIVDTGVEESEAAVEAVLTEAGLGWGDVGHVILTHNHGDHVGSLPAIANLAPGAALYGGAEDIGGMRASRDIAAVGDGDVVFGLDIINTPGHTPGHISVYDPVSRAMAAGDALTGGAGMVTGPNEQFTADMASAIASIAKLGALDITEVFVGHGFPVNGGSAELRALAESL